MSALNLVKLCVGADTVDDLVQWQDQRSADRRARGEDPRPRHVTRMWPRRADELPDGGSLYWVFRGAVLARQQIEDLQEVIDEQGIRRCAIVMSPKIIHVETRPRRPFQGWRYLTGDDAPPDLDGPVADVGLPVELALALNDIGVVARRA